ncbi:FAD-dependent oxidoreductase [Actinomycetospora cinnamomea]|uniref:FAD binding domain-containing protein n=1 Tax=Actinomycetospora cinnamomea TaxID=663609 RepID=A0A2U1F6T9_9PSEU|nr:FAD-dependent monooxygenase [Actinomycetospora cinnamomea]PVZ07905.1 FAD binding domain-containing protein [Actinomycetospora cinnamomea]
MKVLIVGAGTGGMCLAHSLRRAGIEAAVHERDRSRTAGLHGYRVGISPNGARALKACLDPELFATLVATTAAPYDTLAMLTERYRTASAPRAPSRRPTPWSARAPTSSPSPPSSVPTGTHGGWSWSPTPTRGPRWACRSAPPTPSRHGHRAR